ncbi:alcohol dehydrogenase-like regulatory protein ErcA [uncultured Draconibacterium sp.]|uniref:alcohol dehydrogenase-like regulatory protein ErcA n=1 Tax=uncultured Draconibacterium sp. TaxID=1573823 RepID=UPI002AA61F93|nr:alcohol dehydrogenase-like regulatory protein ErcA [uncultured Draconibacterium sp.]
MIVPLRKCLVPEFILGDGATNLANRYIKFFNPKKVLVVTDRGLKKTKLVSNVEKQLKADNISYCIYDNISPNPRDYEVMEGADVYRKEDCNVILAIGGGSPTDAAKGIGIVSTNHHHIKSFEGVDKILAPMPPLVCIPTTAGTSADISQFAIILDTELKTKLAIISKTVVPDTSLIDAETTLTMDKELTAATGIDALVHAIEAYVSTASSVITDMNALEAIKLVKQYLPLTIKSPLNLEYRNKMMLASLLAGIAFSNASLGLVHAMAHALGGLKDAPHGMCNAILLDHVIDFNFESATNKYVDIGNAFGINLDSSNPASSKALLIEALQEFKHICGIQPGLKQIGLKKADFRELAQKAYNDSCIVTNPKDAEIADIEKILEYAW